MADSTKNVAYQITADPSGFAKGMQDAASAATTATGQIEGQFKKVGDAFSQVQKQLLVLAGLVAGGSFFKEAISASNAMTGETAKLQKTLGLTGEQANTLRTALDDIGSDSDTYTGAFTKFAQQLRKNEEGMQAMGLQTRDTNGNLRDSNTLFNEALQTVGQYKPGLDQTTAAMTLFGKSVDEVRALQKLNNGVLEEAAEKNRELGLIVTQENVEASKKYKLAMNDVGDVLTAVKKVIGDAVMPVFTELGNYFAQSGPYVVEIFKGAVMGLVTVFRVVQGAVKTLAGIVFESFSLIVDGAGLVGQVFSRLFAGDFQGAYDAAKGLGKRVGQAYTGALTNFIDTGNETGAAIKKDFDRIYGKGTEMKPAKGGSRTMGEFKDSGGGAAAKEKSRAPLWDAELQEQKLAFQEMRNAEGSFQQFSKAAEIAFWRDKLAITDAGTKENVQVRRKLADLQLEMGKEAFAAELGRLKTEEAEFKNNLDAKLAVLDKEAALIAQRFGRESKEYQDVQRQIVEAKRQAVEQLRQIDQVRSQAARDSALAELQIEQSIAQLQVDLGNSTTLQLLAQEQTFEERRFAIQQQALLERKSLIDPSRDPVEYARINAEIETLEEQHQLRKRQLLNQQIVESTAASRRITDTVLGDMESSLAKMMQGQMKFRDFMKNIWSSILNSITSALAKMLVDFIRNSAAMAAVKKALAAFNIGSSAAEAGAGAAASAAEIPLVGWLMAPVAAAAVFAMASGYASNVPAFSAEGGFDIPGSVNPLIQAHEREMVLPAHIADPLRENLASGSMGGGQPVVVNVHAMDAGSFKSWLGGSGGDVLAKYLKGRTRDFAQ